jgi:hypothetical protein
MLYHDLEIKSIKHEKNKFFVDKPVKSLILSVLILCDKEIVKDVFIKNVYITRIYKFGLLQSPVGFGFKEDRGNMRGVLFAIDFCG